METPPTFDPQAGPPPPPPFTAPRPRQLRRRPDQGHLGGVCAGVAEYFDVDPVLVRIAAVVLAISGPGVIAYVLAWIFVPAADEPPGPPGAAPTDGRDRGTQILGVVLLAIAVSVLWGGWWSPARRWMFPIGLMVLGFWLLLRRGPGEAEAPGRRATQPGDGPPGGAGTNVTDAEATTKIGPPLPGFDGADAGEPPPAPPWTPGPLPGTPGGNGTARRRRMLAPIVMGSLLVWGGVAWLAGVSVESALAVGLCIVGIGFVFGAFVGGSWALIVPAVLIAGALVVASIADIPLSGPVGDRAWAPRSLAEVEERYELSIGEGTLDLTGIALDRGDLLDIEASVGLGHLVIEVPPEVALDISADVSAGETLLLGARDNGVAVSTDRTFRGTGDAGTIELDLQVGFGQIEVRRVEAPLTTTTRPGAR